MILIMFQLVIHHHQFEKNQLLQELEETKQEVERVDDLEFELEDLKKKIK